MVGVDLIGNRLVVIGRAVTILDGFLCSAAMAGGSSRYCRLLAEGLGTTFGGTALTRQRRASGTGRVICKRVHWSEPNSCSWPGREHRGPVRGPLWNRKRAYRSVRMVTAADEAWRGARRGAQGGGAATRGNRRTWLPPATGPRSSGAPSTTPCPVTTRRCPSTTTCTCGSPSRTRAASSHRSIPGSPVSRDDASHRYETAQRTEEEAMSKRLSGLRPSPVRHSLGASRSRRSPARTA